MVGPGLHVALAGLALRGGQEAAGERFRADLAWAASAGLAGVVLDGTTAGMRARELDRSARREVAAVLRRAGLGLGGIDLWIPAEHFKPGTNQDRALGAVLATIDLLDDLATLMGEPGRVAPVHLALTLPRPIPGDLCAALIERADRARVRIADYGWPADEPATMGEPIGPGLDPAVVLLGGGGGGDPVMLAAKFGAGLAGARLSDASAAARVGVGGPGGRLDVRAYAAVLTSAGYRGPVVLDLRGVGEQATAATRAVAAWRKAMPGV